MDRPALLIVVDTNLLIYAHRSMTPEHRLARATLEHLAGVGTGWAITQPSVAEFWSVATHPPATGKPSSVDEARAFLGRGQLLLPGPGFAERLLATEIWTHDRNFVSVPGLPVHDPFPRRRRG